jgi:hypothetical protein
MDRSVLVSTKNGYSCAAVALQHFGIRMAEAVAVAGRNHRLARRRRGAGTSAFNAWICGKDEARLCTWILSNTVSAPAAVGLRAEGRPGVVQSPRRRQARCSRARRGWWPGQRPFAQERAALATEAPATRPRQPAA